jgi:DNA-binding transcriptional LysR family regulator
MVDQLSLPEGIEDLTFVQLRTFVCAARSGSFARTAERLHITQPAVSEQIKALETTLRKSLFLRRKGTTPTLTNDGQQALDAIETVLSQISGLFDPPTTNLDRLTLRISAGPMVRELCLRPLMAKIYRAHPEIEIELHPMLMSADALRMVDGGELDLAIHDAPEGADATSPDHATFVLPLALIAQPGTQDRLSRGDCTLDDFQFIFPTERNRATEKWAHKCLHNLNLKPKHPPHFIDYTDVIVKLVQSGPSIGYLMADAVRADIDAGRVESLDQAPAPMHRYVSLSRHAPPVAREIENMLCKALAGCSAKANLTAA